MKQLLLNFSIAICIFSCQEKIEKNNYAELIKLGYYPSFHQHFEIILNLDEKYLLFYNPSNNELPPPPPPKENATDEEIKKQILEHNQFIADHPKYDSEYIQLTDAEIQKIQKIVNSFTENDFKKNLDKKPVIDGANTSLVILLKNKKLISMEGYEGTINDKNIELTSTVYKILKANSKSKINQTYFNRDNQ